MSLPVAAGRRGPAGRILAVPACGAAGLGAKGTGAAPALDTDGGGVTIEELARIEPGPSKPNGSAPAPKSGACASRDRVGSGTGPNGDPGSVVVACPHGETPLKGSIEPAAAASRARFSASD